MTEREKIISLVKKCTKPDMVDCYHTGYFTLDDEELKAFYHAAIADFLQSSGQYLNNHATREAIKQARNEAFGAALNACIQAEQESGDAKSQLSDEEYIAKSVAAGAVYQAKKLQTAIREMAKEQS